MFGYVNGSRACSCVRVRSRAGADDALIRGMCASATRSLRNAIHRWNTHRYRLCIRMHVAVSMRLATRTNGSPMRARRTHVLRPCVRARVCVWDWARTHPRRHMRARSVGVDRGWLGSQAFNGASAFNANIASWNTASVTFLDYVCATVYLYSMHAYSCIHARLATRTNGSPMRACRTRARVA